MTSISNICQTCLSSDRDLGSLVKFRSLLLELNLKLNHEGGICWECQRHVEKFSRFRSQVQRAQNIINCENPLTAPTLTTLSFSKSYYHYSHQDKTTKSNITCTEAGPIIIKKEIDENVKWNDSTVVDVDAYEDEVEAGECTDHVIPNSVHESYVCEQNTTEIVPDHEGQNHIDTESQVFSELPRITLVKSITDDRNEPTEPCQAYTEIIELNIPIHVPTHDEESDNLHEIEGSTMEPVTQSANRETNTTKSNRSIALSMDKTTDVNLNMNGNYVEHYTDSQDEMDIIKAIDSCLAAADHTNSLTTTTDHTYCVAPNQTHDAVPKASGGVANKIQAKKDVITVKVAYKGILGGATVKCESISDDEHNYDDCYVHASESSMEQSLYTGSVQLDQSLWRKSILLLYTNLRNHTAARIFWYPVKNAVAPQYSKAVKRPMDFRTIGINIKNGVITTTEQFHRDILLMLTNALMYNSSDHCIYLMAKQVLAEAKSQFDMLMSIQTPQTSNQETPNQRPRRRLKSIYYDEPFAKKARTSSPVKPKLEPRDRKTKISPNVQEHDILDCKSKIRKISIEKDTVIGDIWEFDRYNRPKRRDRKRKSKSVKIKAEKMGEAAEKNQYGASKVVTPVKFNESKSGAIKVNTPGFKESKKGASKITPVNFSEAKKRAQPKGKTSVEIKTEMIEEANKKANSKPKVVTTVNFNRDNDVSNTVVRRSGRKRNEINYSIAIHGEKNPRKSIPKLAKAPKVKVEPLDAKIKPKVEKIDSKSKGLDKDDEKEEPTDFHVAITPETLRDLNRAEGTVIKKILQDNILNLALESNFTPRFKGEPIIAEGVVKLWCSDRKSLNWLQLTVKNFPKILGRLTVKNLSELPKKIKSAVSIPGYYGELDVIQKLLNAQNPWAQVNSWSFTSVEQRGESLFVVLGIPPFIIPKLLSRQRQLAYILGSVHIEFFDRQGNLVTTPPGYVK